MDREREKATGRAPDQRLRGTSAIESLLGKDDLLVKESLSRLLDPSQEQRLLNANLQIQNFRF